MKSDKKIQWFFLRGLAREGRHWGSFLDDFRARMPEAEIHVLDLPGAGRYFNMRAPLSIGENATFVREEFAELREPGTRAFLLANSLGGMVAVDWLCRDHSGVDGLVLINTSFKGCSPFWKRLWFEAYPHLARALREEDDITRERHVLSMVSNRPEIQEHVAREWAAIHRERPLRRETFARQLFAASRFEVPAQPPRVPVLLLNSLKDRMVHPSCSEAVARRWGCELRRHPTAGHDLTLDEGPWVADAVADWVATLKKLPPQADAAADPASGRL